MKKIRVLGLAVLFGAMVPAIACNDPTVPRLPDGRDDDDDGRPDDKDDTAFLLMLSTDPVVI